MRKPYTKILIKRLGELVAEIEPRFVGYKAKSQYLFPSNYAFVHHLSSHVWLFLVLFINPKQIESFTVEFGWSRKARFPEVLSTQFLDRKPNPLRFREEEYMERVPCVFLGEDLWWPLEDERAKDEFFRKHFCYPVVTLEQAEVAVKAQLETVRTLLENQVMPYLRDFANFIESDATL